jgi:hypothetical protein
LATLDDHRHRVPGRDPDGPKVVIAGTGRSGTTLLVQILTDLGLETGVSPDAPIDERAAAGLELPVAGPNSPRIVKGPNLSRRLGGLLDAGEIRVEHVVIPIRNLDVAAASRVRLTKYGSDLHTFGGLFGTTRGTRQRQALAIIEYELLFTIAKHDLPHTLIAFPRLATDWDYTFRKLGFLDPTIPAERWREAIQGRVRADLIHETALSRREHVLTALGTVYNGAIVRPLRATRHLIPDRARRRSV